MTVLLLTLWLSAALGEPWEPAVVAGIEQQERMRRTQKPAAVLREARLRAARPTEGAERVARLYLLARAYGIAGDARSAEATYAEVLVLAPRCYLAHHDLAMLALGRVPPDPKAAEQSLRRAVRVHPGFITGHRKLARLLHRLGRKAEAVPHLERVVAVAREDRAAQGLLATLLLETGRPEKAFGLARRLAREDPSEVAPLALALQCLQAIEAKGGGFDREDLVWTLEGLLRVERDQERREALRGALRRVHDEPGGATRGPDPLETLRDLFRRPGPLEPEALPAVIRTLSPSSAPDPKVRQWGLRVLGRHGGYGLVGLVRHSLADPAPEVRPVAADQLELLGRTHPRAWGAAVLALGLHVDSTDPAVRSAARAGIRSLAHVDAQARFDGFWAGSGGRQTRVQALGRLTKAGDSRPEDLVLPYLRDPDPYVVRAAWDAMGVEARRVLARSDVAERRRAWLARLPAMPEDDRDPGAHRARVLGWAAARPR